MEIFSNISALQRTNSRGHTTPESVFVAGKTCFFKKTKQKFRNLSKLDSGFWPFFHWEAWLQMRLKKFQETGCICLRYWKASPTSGLWNAMTLVVIRYLNMFLLQEKPENRVFQKIKQRFRDLSKLGSGFWPFFTEQLDFRGIEKISRGRPHIS